MGLKLSLKEDWDLNKGCATLKFELLLAATIAFSGDDPLSLNEEGEFVLPA